MRDIAEIKDAGDLLRLLSFLEGRTGQLLNLSALSQDLGHARATIERYLSLLERLFITRRLPAWHSIRSKRLIKTAKLHFVDSGIAASLGELEAEQWNDDRGRFGHLLESFVVQQLTARRPSHSTRHPPSSPCLSPNSGNFKPCLTSSPRTISSRPCCSTLSWFSIML